MYPLLVRMQAFYPEGRPYRHTPHVFASLWKEGKFRALYRGVEATTIRGIVLSTSQICSYDQIKQTLKQKGIMKEGIELHLTASLFAGWVLFL